MRVFCGLFYGIAQPLESTADLESLWRRAQGGERTNKVKVLNWTETQVTEIEQKHIKKTGFLWGKGIMVSAKINPIKELMPNLKSEITPTF